MSIYSDSVYNYDREVLAKFFKVDEDVLNKLFVVTKVQRDTTLNNAVKASKIVFVVASALGVASNMFCIFLMATMKGKLKTSIKLLLTLSISDACRSCLDVVWYFFMFNNARFVTSSALTSFGKSRFTVIMCRVLTSMNILTDISSQVTTIMLALVIFLAVKKPMSYNSLMSNSRSTGITLFIWTTSGSMVVCFNVILEEIVNGPEYTKGIDIQRREMLVYTYLFHVYRYMLMGIFGIIMVLNIAIYVQVRISTIKTTNIKRRFRFVLILVLITSCFFLTNLPIILQSFIDTMDIVELYSNKFILYTWHCLPHLLIGWRGLGNSIVYTARLPEIRQQVMRVFCPERVKQLKRKQSMIVRSRGKVYREESCETTVSVNIQ